MILGQEPLGFRRGGFSPPLSLLMSAFSLPDAPPHLTMQLHSPWNAPLPDDLAVESTASAACLSPVIFTAQAISTSELLRTLSRVAASKPTSWLSVIAHNLDHLACT